LEEPHNGFLSRVCAWDRGAGTSTGTYVIPDGVTIYFFETDTEYLYVPAAEFIKQQLLKIHPDEAAVQAIAKETKKAYETIPNYTASGDPTSPDMGVYMVGGRVSSATPVGSELGITQIYPIPSGTSKHLSDIVGGSGAGGVLGQTIYWLACRAAPTNSNALLAVKAKDMVMTSNGMQPLNAVVDTPDTGLKPSPVKTIGRWR
jgi:hypothetical protein